MQYALNSNMTLVQIPLINMQQINFSMNYSTVINHEKIVGKSINQYDYLLKENYMNILIQCKIDKHMVTLH